MVGSIRRGQARELVRMGLPVEVAAVHQAAADGSAMAVDVLGRGMRDDVRAPLEGTAMDRRRKSIVDHQRHAVRMGDLREALDIQHFHARVGEGLAEKKLGFRTEAGVHIFIRGLVVHEGDVDAHLLQGHAQQVEGAAVDVVQAHDVVPRLADVQAGEEVRRLAGGGQDGAHAAFQGVDAGRDHVAGRVRQPRIEIARVFEVEEPAHLVGGFVFERRALHDGHLPGFAASGLVARMDAKGVDLAHVQSIVSVQR